jgi:hypothetical protein
MIKTREMSKQSESQFSTKHLAAVLKPCEEYLKTMLLFKRFHLLCIAAFSEEQGYASIGSDFCPVVRWLFF